MADHALTLELDDETFARLAVAAAAEGLSLEVWAQRQLGGAAGVSGVREDAPAFDALNDWTEADRRLAGYDHDGDAVDAETWLAELEAAVRARRAE